MLLLAFGSVVFGVSAQQLVLNEFSQGSSGTKEYIELVVVGNKSCTDSCMDLRGWIIDDHNGWYGASTGMGIATGCLRLAANAPSWQCVPYGSVILIYNNGDKNASISLADDPTDANKDNIYIVPANSALIEYNSSTPVSPSSLSYTYPSTGFSPGGNWSGVGFANSGDAVIITSPAALNTAHFSLTYGNVNGGTIHMSGSGGGVVYYQSANLPFTAASWQSGSAGVNETPGMPNTNANANWINAMRVSTGGLVRDTLHETICQGDSYTLNGNIYTTSGVYEATFLRGSGCDSIVTLFLTVNPKPLPPVVVTPVAYCQDSTALPLTGAGFSLRWYTTPTGGTGTYIPPVPSTSVPGTFLYYITQTVDGCESGRSITTVVIHPTPLPPVTSVINYCQYAPAAPLTATGSKLLWYTTPFGGSGTATAPVPNTSVPGTYKWYVSQTLEGCEGPRGEVVVNVLEINAGFTVNMDTLCITTPLVCTNTSTGAGLTYFWDFGDSTTSISKEPDHKYKRPGIYTVMLAIQNAQGCTDTMKTVVGVFALPEAGFAIEDSLLCVGEAAKININNPEGFTRIAWEFGDGSYLDKGDNLQHAFDKGGTFVITMHGHSIACGVLDWSDTVFVDDYAKVYLGEDTAMCPNGSPIVLQDLFANPAKKYVWSTGDTTASLLVRHHGMYAVTATVGACSSTDSINVHKSCYIDIPNAFTPNGNGMNEYFFPRVLLSRGVSKFDMKIFNRWGQLIFETDKLDGRGWDGKFNGVPQFSGVFVYLIDVAFVNGTREYYQGNVTLLR